MAYEVPGYKLSLVAGADLTDKQFCAMALSGQLGVVAAASTTSDIVGVLQQPAIAGETTEVMVHGVTKGVLGGTVADGDVVEVDASGHFITKTTGYPVGFALEGGAVGNLGTILLK